jgi:hypothetical protein
MAKRQHRSLAQLERELHAHDAKRSSILAEIKAVVESLSVGAMVQLARIGQATGLGAELPSGGKGGRRPGFQMSAEARKKISLAAKKRWAARRATATR